ncbi:MULTISPECIES: sucrase ferredoxin [unclassified Anabaena]|uniref:sucrase ferredoxin n=1 Tax=unclassified Anabaena TaxID=2619674 RepID=UPI001444D6FE|nr:MULTISPECIES: sucrase ferredoxin [unclassified Anabaena]MTJ09590.1 sucrase ferredoxin [Anabaena sp. UHCC 0204]MTJ55623.1 sucrase ferredoxin [Anabaena sp. UHCC 0253]
MNNFFCADHSRQIQEDVIGSATNYQTYILVECPTPWAYEAFNSKWVPDNLRSLVEDIQRAKLPIRFLLIANDESHQVEETTLLIYQQQEGLSSGYQKQEFKLPNIEQVAGVVSKYLAGVTTDYEITSSITRDILICTHGSHDQCCARYGNPFYFYAQKTVSDLQLNHVRMWRSSHFGGHRFAPTAIDFPQGRYYGVLDQDAFKSILTQTGDIQCLNKVYRGWGILPNPLQILERELMLRLGWDWFNYKVTGKILEKSLDNNTILGELSFEQPSGDLYTYQAKLVKDPVKTQTVKGSCHASQEIVCVKYAVSHLWLVAKKVATYS